MYDYNMKIKKLEVIYIKKPGLKPGQVGIYL